MLSVYSSPLQITSRAIKEPGLEIAWCPNKAYFFFQCFICKEDVHVI